MSFGNNIFSTKVKVFILMIISVTAGTTVHLLFINNTHNKFIPSQEELYLINLSKSYGSIPDTDGDGISDRNEVEIFETNLNSKDSDSDGFTDELEVLNCYNPNSFDTTLQDNNGKYTFQSANSIRVRSLRYFLDPPLQQNLNPSWIESGTCPELNNKNREPSTLII